MKIGVVGASGYVGGELLRLLVSHPRVEISIVTSRQKAGEYVHRVHPSLKGFVDLAFSPINTEKLANSCDMVFISVPHTKANKIVKDHLRSLLFFCNFYSIVYHCTSNINIGSV